MSTNAAPTETVMARRKERNGTISTIQQPLNISLYNKYMGRVDMADQMRQYYHPRMKSIKVYM